MKEPKTAIMKGDRYYEDLCYAGETVNDAKKRLFQKRKEGKTSWSKLAIKNN